MNFNLRSRKEGKEDYISNIAYMLLTDACKNTLCTLRIIMLSRLLCPDLFFARPKNYENGHKMFLAFPPF